MLPADTGEIRLGSKVHIGYYDQEHQVLHMETTLFDEIQDTYPTMNNTQIRNTLASFLFTGDDVFKLIRDCLLYTSITVFTLRQSIFTISIDTLRPYIHSVSGAACTRKRRSTINI